MEIFIFGEINLTMKEDKRKEKYVRKKNKIKSATKKGFLYLYITSVKSTLINYETLVEVPIFTPKKLI